jgi:hypothetical protein
MAEQLQDFTVDPAILYSIIQSQAGTLSKAFLEGVMNSIDARATSVSVTLDTEGFTIFDDGRGFQSRDEIDNWFGRFGTPHQEGDSTYGRFRMGRGQMMAFAITTWRTGTFKMSVDIKNKGMGFGLKEKLRAVKGCRITGKLYTPLSGSELEDVIRDFKSLVKYAQIPVRLNGKVISKNPKDLKWDLETDDAYIQIDREKDKPLMVYNLGVLVRDYPNWTYGCGGVVVSKRPLEVNFARNDILTSSCEVWRRTSQYIKSTNVKKVAKKGSLNDGERSFLAKQYIWGDIKEVDVDPMDLKLITDITGRHHSVRDLMDAPRISSSTDKQGRTGSQLHRQGAAFVLSQETLSRFSVSCTSELLRVLGKATGRTFPEAVDFDKVAEGFSENFAVLAEDDLPVEERLALSVVHAYHEKFFGWYRTFEKTGGIRQLRVGDSNVAKAWTDGRTYITLERDMLKRAVKRGTVGFMDLLGTLTHEYCHDDADLESHDHDKHFFNKYHDLMQGGGLGKLLSLALEMDKTLTKTLGKAGLLQDKRADGAGSSSRSQGRPMSKAEQKRHELASRQISLAI